MTIQKLMLLHHMSSSSDALRSKKYVEERKLKLKQGLEKKKEERVIIRPQVTLDDDDDDDMIPTPPQSSLSKIADSIRSRRQSKKFMIGKKSEEVPMRKSKPLGVNHNENKDCRYSRRTINGLETPSTHIRKIFQAAAPIDDDDTVTGRTMMRTAIEDAQKRVCKDDENENDHENEEPVIDLRGLYQKYLQGTIEKEPVVRAGGEWTSSYRERRLRRNRFPNKRLRRQTSCGNSVSSAPARIQPTKIDEMGFATFG